MNKITDIKKLKVGVISIFPEMFAALSYGVVGRAKTKGQLEISCFNPRDYTQDKHGYIDDRPYGGGPGMLIKAQPLHDSVQAAKAQLGKDSKVVYLSPQGQQVNQSKLLEEVRQDNPLIMVCGRYEGVDERFIEQDVDEQWSVGDLVISGGELASMVFIDALIRLVPGVLNHHESAQCDSFMQGLLDCPHYTRPEKILAKQVPKVLLEGNHQEINRWRLKQALGRTWQYRPDLLEKRELTEQEKILLDEYKRIE